MMDTATQKPFACRTQGCGMSFTNEDHLSVHEKKHEMALNLELGNKSSNVFVADQTPTPTRLIKNCEEVGLFDDLKHVNPFDETFRRAVESKNGQDSACGDLAIGSSSLSESTLLTNEDSLHTPQVFPNIEGGNEEKTEDFKIEKQKVILSENISFKRKTSVNEDTQAKFTNIKKQRLLKEKPENFDSRQDVNNSEENKSQNNPVSATSIILPSAVSIIQPQVITVGFPTTTVVQSKPILLPKPADIENRINSSQTVPVKEKLRAVLNNSKTLSKRTIVEHKQKGQKVYLKSSSKQTYDEECLERRRAAAMRYRKKIKKEQADLKKKNAELLAENAELKSIIKNLKQLLDTHQNCDAATPLSVSLPLNESQQFIKAPAIQIPPATVKLVMNIPKLIIHPGKVPIPALSSNIQK